jgi:hypothetical protein
MGLLTQLTTAGSNLSKHDGATPPTNNLATKSSTLHANGNQPGYSLNGSTGVTVRNEYGEYEDGVNNSIPQPSQLDLDGVPPTITPKGQKLPYIDNLPG